MVNSAVTPTQLVAALVGSGLTVSNITMNCPTGASGTFANGNTTNIGLTNGIMLTSGSVNNAIGPDNSPSMTTCSGTIFNDPQLMSLDPQANEDVCILEFDVVATCNNLQIRFVFGSEEYPEFVNSGYNDAFGFWVTGPGGATCTPNFYNNTNVATLPNNVTIVSIDNVNATTNSAYYIDNFGGATIQYDAFTTVLTRNVALCPCQTYHWKLAIADAGDCAYDSGVFIDFMTCSTNMSLSMANTNSSCSGCTGTANVTASGGTPPYNYSWSPAPGAGQGTANASQLCAGTYTCTVTDAIPCSPGSTIAVTITAPAPMNINSNNTNATCNGGCDATANVTVTNATPPLTYTWTPVPGGGQGTASATGLCAGTYTVDVGDNTGCTATHTIAITEPPPLSIAMSSNPANCGGANGTASATPAGSGLFSYLWAPGGQTTQTATNLFPGTYTVTVTNSANCSGTATVTVGNLSTIASTQLHTDVNCAGALTGSASINVTGANGMVSYSWSPNVSTSATATNIAAGTYSITATDGAGCITSQTITITEPPQLMAAVGGFNVSCFGACDGQMAAIPQGGTPGYTYLWSTGCTLPNCNNVCGGSYNITITDANGCTLTQSVVVTEPSPITLNTSSTPAHCNQADGSAIANATGGSGTLSYTWMPSGTGSTLNNILPGTYQVTVTDANGCTETAVVPVSNIPGPQVVVANITNIDCYGNSNGSITVNAMGGTGGLSYAWTPAPAAGNSNTVSGLTAGTYQVTVTDGEGCTASIGGTVVEPPLLTVAPVSTPSSVCIGQPVQLSANEGGGTPGYTINWNPGGTGSTITVNPTATTTYTVDVTDQNGCNAVSIVGVTVSDNPVPLFTANQVTGCAPVCVNFNDLSTVSIGTITQWSWDFGDGNTSTAQNPYHCYNAPGPYTVTLNVVNSLGCSNTLVMTNYINVLINPVAAFYATPPTSTILSPVINFVDASNSAASWNWDFGAGQGTSTDQNPSHSFDEADCYQVSLTVASVDGCTSNTTLEVCITPDIAIYVPNGFTPNNDGLNDVFMPASTGIDPEHFEMYIFDRWGSVVFYTNDISIGWDGRPMGKSGVCQIDSYVWKINTGDIMGNSHTLIGQVSLLR